jgi:glycosyltransferase involved in cell wall biosynthesis
LLRNRFGNDALEAIDLSMPKVRLFTLFFSKIFRCRQVVLLGGPRSGPVFLILLLLTGKLPVTTVVAIGNWVGEVGGKSWLLRRFSLPLATKIFVETSLIRISLLQDSPNCRVSIMPNFNLSNSRADDSPDRFLRNPMRLVFLSRVCQTKGVFLAINAVHALHERGVSATLDIYGSFDEDGIEEALTALLSNDVQYKGVVASEQVIETLTSYDIFVFPTFYKGEGFPNVILDAFCSGTPVVCSDWKSNSEVISDGRTGLIFSLDDPEGLISALVRLNNDRELLLQMSANARAEALKYQPDSVAAPFIGHLTERLYASNG